METIAWVSGDSSPFRVKYERFSGDTGVCFIKMDKYKKVQSIEDLTRDYLKDSEFKSKLERVATEIVEEYLQKTVST